MAEGKVSVTEQRVEIVEGQNPDVSIAVTEQVVVISEAVVGIPGDDKHFTFDQATPSATWTISHNLNKRPSVTVVDSGGNEWQTAVEHISPNQCVVRFSAPFAGRAYLN